MQKFWILVVKKIGNTQGLVVSVFGLWFLASGCFGEFDSGSGPGNGSPFKPSSFFSGRRIGHQMIMDRNRNLKESATIQRVCDPSPDLNGQCKDTIEFHYANKSEDRQIRWEERYLSGNRIELSISDELGSLAGFETNNSPLILLQGKRIIPMEKDKSMSVSVRFQKLEGPGDLVVQTEIFHKMGVTMGVVETIWIRQ